jgi:hypothetical protein
MAGYLVAAVGTTLQYFTDQGIVLAGGTVSTFTAGTSTPTPTYTDSTLGVSNGTVITLTSAGRLPASCWVAAGTTIKMVLKDSGGNTIANGTIDNLPAVSDPSAVFPLTAPEIAASVTPSNFSAPAGPSWSYISRYAGSLATALTVAGGNNFSIFIDSLITVGTNATVPSTCSLVFIGAGSISVSGGVTLTINGAVEGNLTYVNTFLGAGTTTISATSAVYLANKMTVPGSAATPANAIGNSGTSFTVDWSKSNVHTVTMTGNVAAGNMTLSNGQDGQTINIVLTQDGTGSRTLGNATGVKWPSGTVGVLSTAASAIDILTITQVSGTKYATLTKTYS